MAAYVAIGGVVSFSGWVLDRPRLADWGATGVATQPNAALAALLAGSGLVAAALRRERVAWLAGGVVLAIGAATLCEHVYGVDLGIDTLFTFGRSWGARKTLAPGRMGPPGALCWTCVGLALLLPALGPRWRGARPVLGLLISGVSGLSLIGFLFHADPLYALPRLTAIALQTATFLCALGLGLVAGSPRKEPMRMLLSPTASGMLARRGLPIAIVAPIGIAFLRLQGQRAGLYDTEMGAALASSAFVGVACAMLAWGSVAVRKRERALAVANVARSKTETALRVSEARVVATLESLSDGFVTLGATYRFQFVNREAERLLRRTRDELLGRSLWELFPGMLGSEVEAALRDVTRAGSTRSVEAHDPVLGRWFAYRIYPSGSSGVSMYFRDITDERLATERAYKGEQQARALLAVIPGGAAFVVDRELRYLLAGGEALGRAGFTPEDLIGKTISEVLPPELAREYEPFYRRGLAGESFGYDHHAHGRWFVTHGVPLRDETGDVYAVLAFSHDITERKEAETALAVADRRKDEFLAMLAHELRNPIASIANALALLERGPGAADDFAKLRELMHRQVRHMVRIIDDLLDVSRITRGLLELRREPLDLASVIRDAAEACRPMMERRGHTFTVALPATTVPVDGDAIRLSQVVGNLLFNACKYTPAGGRVELTLERGTSTAEVRVRDSGIGIPSEMLTTIFELFTQVDRSVERAQEGLGIGLSLAKRLVEMHGGAIRAESEGAGRGTVVIVTLPRMADPPPDGIPVAAGSAQGGAAREVLVVDDNKDAADSLATLLRFDGHEVRVAYDGDVAIREVRARKPDVILLDLGLPKMSGYDVCRTLRCDDPDRAILVVSLTGWGGSEDRARTHAAGFDAHLVKPVDLAALREVLERPLEPARDRPAPLPG